MPNTQADVVVVGGGVAGTVLALLLARQGVQTALVERRPTQPPQPPSGPKTPAVRHLALSARSRNILQDLGVWEQLSSRAVAVTRMSVWDGAGGGAIDFDSADVQEEALAWILPEDWLGEQLWRHLQGSPIHIYRPREIRHLSRHFGHRLKPQGAQAQVELDGGECINGSLVVAADGARSQVRHLAAIGCMERDTGQAVLGAAVHTEHPHEQRAVQVFSNSGPVGLLPCMGNGPGDGSDDGHWRSLIWSAPLQQAEHLQQLPAAEFCRQLSKVADGMLGECLAVGERHVAPIVHRRAETFAVPAVLLIGDAARSMHPLAGQGLNLALADAAAVADCFAEAAPHRVLTARQLRRYDRRRQWHHGLMGGAVDVFLSIFAPGSGDIPWWCQIRGTGMRLTASLPGARKACAGIASGRWPVQPQGHVGGGGP